MKKLNNIENQAVQADAYNNNSILHRIFATNWGLAVIGGLVALAIGVSAFQGGQVNSVAEEIPEAEIETVAVIPTP